MRVNTVCRRFKTGFTLTELMAVVIIVAILAGLAAGSYKKAVERSRFSDGLAAAHTVMQAVERYYADTCAEGSCVSKPNVENLDVSFANQQSCGTYCIKTKYFEITVGDGSVTAKRTNKGNDYSIQVFAETFGGNQRTKDRCIPANNVGKDLCISLGYTASCSGTGSHCTKP